MTLDSSIGWMTGRLRSSKFGISMSIRSGVESSGLIWDGAWNLILEGALSDLRVVDLPVMKNVLIPSLYNKHTQILEGGSLMRSWQPLKFANL